MNVTYLIRNKEFKKILNKNINYKVKQKNKEMKYYAAPKNYSLIGHAYEILFQIEYIRKHKRPNLLNIKAFRKSGLLQSFYNKVSDKEKKRINKILNKLRKIEYKINKKIHKINEKDIIFLTNVSNIREIKDLYTFNKVKKDDKRDIIELKKSLKKYKSLLKDNLEFNINVNLFSIIGEIDIKTKNSIIDIKTTMSNKLSKDFINQLVVYYILAKSDYYNPKKVGILFSRYGYIEMIKIRKLISEKNERKIKEQLLKRVKTY